MRYEFEFNHDIYDKADVNSGDVIYDDNKIFNLPNYLIAEEPNSTIKKLLQKPSGLQRLDWISLWMWLQCGTPNKNSLRHITDELVFKKPNKYIFEDEYRFIHLTGRIGPKPLIVVLEQQKTLYEKIGLKLVKISTSDINKVKNETPGLEIEIAELYFD